LFGGRLCLAFGVNELRVEIDSALQFNGIKADTDLPENLVLFKSLKNTKL
jgi:hypothetical protein